MKSLKITLLLAVFALTFSGSSVDQKVENDLPTVNEQEFNLLVHGCEKKKKPGNNS